MKIEINDDYFCEEELENTPKRYERFLKEWLIDSSNFEFTTFKNPNYDEMVMITDITFYSMCSHHLVPFFGKAHIAYIPDKKLAGLSKFARVVDKFSHKPQIQERLTMEILRFLVAKLDPHWLMVIMEAEHLCMSMRGVNKPGHKTITNAIYEKPKCELSLNNCKEEFMKMIKK